MEDFEGKIQLTSHSDAFITAAFSFFFFEQIGSQKGKQCWEIYFVATGIQLSGFLGGVEWGWIKCWSRENREAEFARKIREWSKKWSKILKMIQISENETKSDANFWKWGKKWCEIVQMKHKSRWKIQNIFSIPNIPHPSLWFIKNNAKTAKILSRSFPIYPPSSPSTPTFQVLNETLWAQQIIKNKKNFLFTTAYKVNANGICGSWRPTPKMTWTEIKWSCLLARVLLWQKSNQFS